MDSKKCSKCNSVKPLTEFYTQVTSTKNKHGVIKKHRGYQSRCKTCKGVKSSCNKFGTDTLDDMIEFAQGLGFRSASYAMDKYGKEQFKQMYYDSKRESGTVSAKV